MKTPIGSKILAFLFLAISATTFAASAVRVEPKKALEVLEGDYIVTVADSAVKDENLCVKDFVHTISWSGGKDSAVLSIGATRGFSDFNAGLISDSHSNYKSGCKYSDSTQALDHRLTNDHFSNCREENITSHSEIIFKGETVEFSREKKISRAGKVIVVPAKCTLKKIKSKS